MFICTHTQAVAFCILLLCPETFFSYLYFSDLSVDYSRVFCGEIMSTLFNVHVFLFNPSTSNLFLLVYETH